MDGRQSLVVLSLVAGETELQVLVEALGFAPGADQRVHVVALLDEAQQACSWSQRDDRLRQDV